MDEEGFLRTILNAPKDDAPLLVYADWLEERGDEVATAKSEFLRLSAASDTQALKKGQRKARRNRLQQLAAELDTEWLAIVSRLRVESCQGKRAQVESGRSFPISFDYVCDLRWEDLGTTEDKAVRFCDKCKHNVHFCDTITAAREHAWAGHCIAVDLGVIRRHEDLEPERHWMGMPSPETVRKEYERMQPDPVSTQREQKRQVDRQLA